MSDNKSSGELVRLEQTAVDDSLRWFPESLPLGLPHLVLCLAGEVGELANEVKKIQRGTQQWEDARVQYKVNMEVADIFTYLLLIGGILKIDLEAAYNVKRQFNEERFGPGAGGKSNGAKRPVRLDVPGEAREG